MEAIMNKEKEVSLDEIDSIKSISKLLDIWFTEMNIISAAEADPYSRTVNSDRITKARLKVQKCTKALVSREIYHT